MTVTHTERFCAVTPTGTGFEISSYALNPGLAAMFPWLSDVANRYEKYKFRTCHFRYVPQSAAAAGTVSLAFDFDPNDDPPATMEEANTYHDYVTTSIWTGATLAIDLANGDRLPQKDTRPGLPGVDLDLNVYDVGKLHVMTQGAAAGVVGYLEVVYVVDLFIHQVQNGVGGSSDANTDLDATHLIGSDAKADPNGYLPVDFTSTNKMTFTQPFEGLVTFDVVGGTLVGNFAPVVSSTGTTGTVTQVAAGDAAEVVGFFPVRAKVGTTLTPTIGAASVSEVLFTFSRASFNALNYL